MKYNHFEPNQGTSKTTKKWLTALVATGAFASFSFLFAPNHSSTATASAATTSKKADHKALKGDKPKGNKPKGAPKGKKGAKPPKGKMGAEHKGNKK
ncbi:hypothetical protein ACYATP_02285 [Lactobacillaceae bacterium Melli_B4]